MSPLEVTCPCGEVGTFDAYRDGNAAVLRQVEAWDAEHRPHMLAAWAEPGGARMIGWICARLGHPIREVGACPCGAILHLAQPIAIQANPFGPWRAR